MKKRSPLVLACITALLFISSTYALGTEKVGSSETWPSKTASSDKQADNKTTWKKNAAKEGPAWLKPLDTSWVQRKYLDIPYAERSPAQKIDIYLPSEGNGPFPVIIEIHPGGFMSGMKSGVTLGAILKTGLQHNYAVVSASYRLSDEALFPAAINDIKTAIRFLRANAGQYHLDGNRMATWGLSAGGNLSALAAVTGNKHILTDVSLGYADVSDAVQAAVDWFGPLQFSTMDAQFKALGIENSHTPVNSPQSGESRYIGKVIGSKEGNRIAEQANPANYIDKNVPPILIQHGTADTNVPFTQSLEFSNKLIETLGKDKVLFLPVEGAGHGGREFFSEKNMAAVFAFLDNSLK